jgi:hypothetical protein
MRHLLLRKEAATSEIRLALCIRKANFLENFSTSCCIYSLVLLKNFIIRVWFPVQVVTRVSVLVYLPSIRVFDAFTRGYLSIHGARTYRLTGASLSGPVFVVFGIVTWHSWHVGCRDSCIRVIYGVFQPGSVLDCGTVLGLVFKC